MFIFIIQYVLNQKIQQKQVELKDGYPKVDKDNDKDEVRLHRWWSEESTP